MIRRLWRSWRRLRLGTRLALGLGVLSLAVFAVVGTALTASMREYLQARLVDQMKLVQVVQSKDAATHGTVERQPYYGWYTAVYDVTGGSADLRRPADVPADSGALTDLAETRARAGQDLTRSVRIDGRGPYLLRACEVRPGVVLVSAAPLGDVENTMDRLIAVQVVAYGLALLALVVLGRRMLRRGLRPLSEMARTAHGIASHDLTRSAARNCRCARPAGPAGARWRSCAPRSTRCWSTSTTPSRCAPRRSGGCAGSSPTPRTSCAPR
ncbi:histidine kinase OS=Streptomyces fumanus OX=67302 GN=GCM10018772_39760 PE=4 SV=1 [Streptomyces fumanus]